MVGIGSRPSRPLRGSAARRHGRPQLYRRDPSLFRQRIDNLAAQQAARELIDPGTGLCDELCAALGVARSNVSTSLRELQNWGIIKVVHVLGDRRDHFESMKDVWEMFRLIMDQRKKREIDPTVELLRACVDEAERSGSKDKYTHQRLTEMKDFFETASSWYSQLASLPTSGLVKLVKMGERIRKLVG